jgi:multidrug efflux pump subunit AcrA (membrane-fusion protein)
MQTLKIKNSVIYILSIIIFSLLIILMVSCDKKKEEDYVSHIGDTSEEADKVNKAERRIKISDEQIMRAGIKTKIVERRHLYKKIRTVGRVAFDPELAIAEEEYISSLKALDKIEGGTISEIRDRTANLVNAAKRKLKLLGLSEKQIKELEKTRQVQTNLILPEEKMWIYGYVYENELGWVKTGEKVKVTTSQNGGEFHGNIVSLSPVVDPRTRSVTFRAEINNVGLKLKPGMYVDVEIQSMYTSPSGDHMVLVIPKSALLDTGQRKIVWIDRGNGEYEAREVQVGPEAISIIDEKEVKIYPVLKGLREKELVVTKANFLIDSQSQITGKAASAYGGALDTEEKKAPPILHIH